MTAEQDTGYAYDLGGNVLKRKERVTDCGINRGQFERMNVTKEA